MKRKKLTGITLLVAGALVSTAIGGALLGDGVKASAAAETFALSDIFAVSSATIGRETITAGETTKNVAAFELSDEGSVTLKRDLAFKWYEADEQDKAKGVKKNLTLKFAFKTLDFTSVTLAMDSDSAWATENDKATNKVEFVKNGEALEIKVNGVKAENAPEIKAGDVLAFELIETETDGEFTAKLNGTEIGKFENVGANWSEYEYGSMNPLKITADLGTTPADGAKATVLLYEINGQTFDNVSEDSKVTDNAAPVLVVNEALDGFMLGTAFSLNYAVVDVLKDSNLTTTLEYYQYNPTTTAGEETYKTLSTSTYFFSTVYEKDGTTTTVFNENNGEEYVAIKATLADGTFNGAEGNEAKAVYDLAWYANEGRTKTFGDVTYLILDRNESGAYYKYLEPQEIKDGEGEVTGYENKLVNVEEYETKKDAFEKRLAEIASEVYAGSNSKIEFPSFEWMIGDNNGYRNLKFTISYRAPGSTNASTSSSLSYNNLTLSVSKEGKYEFKIFANDKAGNTMKYSLDGELVDVTSSNVWDIDEIPTFGFEIANKGLYVKEKDTATASDRMSTEVLDKSYTLGSLEVVGATDLQEAYALYKIDLNKYAKFNDDSQITSITYKQLATAVKAKGLNNVTDGNYFDFYLNVYAEEIAKNIGGTAAEVKACFTRVYEPDDRVNGKESDGEYEWSESSKSFQTIEEGNYLILADYWEGATAKTTRATAYKLIVVESEAASIKGETDWLKNNVVSVVLFAIAGVMLILIIILLLIKPSDETLEEVDVKAVKKAKKEKPSKKDEE
ncbi:MAG: hypothetical protein IJX91_00595 [Clostridia bacterium]|nr:hypothetical protein [Clostridia bacterium]